MFDIWQTSEDITLEFSHNLRTYMEISFDDLLFDLSWKMTDR